VQTPRRGGLLAQAQHQASEAAAREGRARVHGAHPGGVASRIEQCCVAPCGVIAAEQGGAAAPSAAGRKRAVAFDHEIGAVVDQLGIQAHDVERRFDGLGAKKIAQQSADRRGHQHAQRRDVLAARQPMREGRVRRRQFVPAFGA
jgi:hypothetical protein